MSVLTGSDLAAWLLEQIADDEELADHYGGELADRVAADAASKRRVVERCVVARQQQGIYGEDGQAELAEAILSAFAASYSDRPGYLERLPES